MKTIILSTFLALAAYAADPSAAVGTWKWKFQMPDGAEVMPKLTIKQDGDTYSGTTEIRPGSAAPVKDLKVTGDQISFAVVREVNGQKAITRYSGNISGKHLTGKITSNWNGQEQSYDWTAKKMEGFEGTWRWASFNRDSTLKIADESGKLTGAMGGGRGRSSTPVTNLVVKGNEISFQVEREFGETKFLTIYEGFLSGDKIVGNSRTVSTSTPRTNEWNATRIE